MNIIQRCRNNRNRLIIAIVVKLERLCCCQIVLTQMIQFLAIFVKQWYDFHHNSMRSRWIFDVFDLNKFHFKFQYEFSIVNFIYWMQMLLRCEINEIAKQWRNVKLRNLIKFNSNFEILHEIFLKKFTNKFVQMINQFRIDRDFEIQIDSN